MRWCDVQEAAPEPEPDPQADLKETGPDRRQHAPDKPPGPATLPSTKYGFLQVPVLA